MTTVYISFDAEINLNTTEQLLGVTFNQIAHGATHIYYLFSTPGGFVAQGMTLYNTIRGLPVDVTMHNVGNVDSIGNAIFLAGRHRYACQHSTFMFHGVAFNMAANTNLGQKDLEEKLDSLLADQKRIGGIIADQTTLNSKQINGLFRQAQTKNAAFALEKGIVHEIRDVAIPAGAPVVQLVFKR